MNKESNVKVEYKESVLWTVCLYHCGPVTAYED